MGFIQSGKLATLLPIRVRHICPQMRSLMGTSRVLPLHLSFTDSSLAPLPLAFGWSAITSRDGERRQTSPSCPALPEPGTSVCAGRRDGQGISVFVSEPSVFCSVIAAVLEGSWPFPSSLHSEGQPGKGRKGNALDEKHFFWRICRLSKRRTQCTGPLRSPSPLPRPPPAIIPRSSCVFFS